MEKGPLITGSIRVPASLLGKVKEGMEGFFQQFKQAHGITTFSTVTVSGYHDAVEEEADFELTPEQLETVTAARGQIVASMPHPGFGLRSK